MENLKYNLYSEENESIAKAMKEAEDKRNREIKQLKADYNKVFGDYKYNKENRVTPWLLIRHSLIDMGLRPIASGTPFWISPDIWVESSDPLGNPVAGEENFINVRIFNLGSADAAPVKVDFYWADPSLGLNAANMNLVGTEWVEVKSLEHKIVKCKKPWIPTFVNNGHECLIVNCTNYILDPIRTPFEPVLDRHVGQRNVHVIKAQAGQKIDFKIFFNNLFPIKSKHLITTKIERVFLPSNDDKVLNTREIVEQIFNKNSALKGYFQEIQHSYSNDKNTHHVAKKIGDIVKRKLKNETKNLLHNEDELSQINIKATISEQSIFIKDSQTNTKYANHLFANTHHSYASNNEKKQLVIDSIEMKKNEQRSISGVFEIPRNAKAGEFILFHLHQESMGYTLGGYTIILQIQE